jgi:hypothetical protein
MLVLSRKAKERIVIRVMSGLVDDLRATLRSGDDADSKLQAIEQLFGSVEPEQLEISVVRSNGLVRLGVDGNKDRVHVLRGELDRRAA